MTYTYLWAFRHIGLARKFSKPDHSFTLKSQNMSHFLAKRLVFREGVLLYFQQFFKGNYYCSIQRLQSLLRNYKVKPYELPSGALF